MALHISLLTAGTIKNVQTEISASSKAAYEKCLKIILRQDIDTFLILNQNIKVTIQTVKILM